MFPVHTFVCSYVCEILLTPMSLSLEFMHASSFGDFSFCSCIRVSMKAHDYNSCFVWRSFLLKFLHTISFGDFDDFDFCIYSHVGRFWHVLEVEFENSECV